MQVLSFHLLLISVVSRNVFLVPNGQLSPEILNRIFNYAALSECVNAAQVCRHWSATALDRVWRQLDSVVPLLKLLGPMTESHTGLVRRSIRNMKKTLSYLQHHL